MVFRVLLLLGPLLGLVLGDSGRGGRLRRSHGGTSGASELMGGNPAETGAPFVGGEEDEDAGFRAFGRVVEKVTVLGVLVVALLIVGLILSLFGVFESDVWDPPV